MPNDDLSALWELLGWFVFKYAAAERIFYLYLLREFALPIELARANFGDARVTKARQALNRLRKAKGLAKDDQLDRALDQLITISRTRNDIFHYGTHPGTDAGIHIDDTLWKYDNISRYEVDRQTFAFGSQVPVQVPVFELFEKPHLFRGGIYPRSPVVRRAKLLPVADRQSPSLHHPRRNNRVFEHSS